MEGQLGSFTFERYCPGLRWAPYCLVLGGTHSGHPFEGFGEVGLVCETSRQSNLGERIIRCGDFMAGKLDAPMPQVFSYALVVVPTE